MSTCDEIQNTVHTPDKVLNVFMHEELCFGEIQYVGKHVKWPMCMTNGGVNRYF